MVGAPGRGAFSGGQPARATLVWLTVLSLLGIETRVHAAPAGQCAYTHFLLQVTRSQQFPRSPGVGASSTPSSAVSAEMMGSLCLPTVGLPCWWRKMAPSPRFVVMRRELQVHLDLAGSGLGR